MLFGNLRLFHLGCLYVNFFGNYDDERNHPKYSIKVYQVTAAQELEQAACSFSSPLFLASFHLQITLIHMWGHVITHAHCSTAWVQLVLYEMCISGQV